MELLCLMKWGFAVEKPYLILLSIVLLALTHFSDSNEVNSTYELLSNTSTEFENSTWTTEYYDTSHNSVSYLDMELQTSASPNTTGHFEDFKGSIVPFLTPITPQEKPHEVPRNITRTFLLTFTGRCVNIEPENISFLNYFSTKSNFTCINNNLNVTNTSRSVLNISFIFNGQMPDFVRLKQFLYKKLNSVFNISEKEFTLVEINIKSEKNAPASFDDPEFKESLFLSIYIAFSCSAGVAILIWLIFFVVHKCRDKPVLPKETVDNDQVRINVDSYELRKIPRLNTDYVRGESTMMANNNNFQTSVIPFEDDVITISSQMHRQDQLNGSTSPVPSRMHSIDPEDLPMTPRQFRTFSRLEIAEERPGEVSTEMLTLEPRNMRPSVHFQGLENPLYSTNPQ